MRPIRYYDVVSHRRNPYHLRRELVQAALREGISMTARSFHTTRKTVRKWLRRFEEKGLAGLKEMSRAPHAIPHKTPPDVEVVVVKLRQRMPAFGPRRLKVTYGLEPSTWAIARILRQHGLSRKRRRKAARRRDLRQQKAALAPFQRLQFDVKDLSDIPAYWRKGSALPRYQHSCRDVRTGAAWVSYALQNTSTHAALFAGLVLGQLARYGVDLSQVTAQTDNGSEYGGMIRKRGTDAFTAVVEAAGARHTFIPPGASTYNAEVEAFHRRIEEEFYSQETLRSRPVLLAKSYAYQLWFNFLRPNFHRQTCTPAEILVEAGHAVALPALNLPPLLLDDLIPGFRPGRWSEGGYLVPYSYKWAPALPCPHAPRRLS